MLVSDVMPLGGSMINIVEKPRERKMAKRYQ